MDKGIKYVNPNLKTRAHLSLGAAGAIVAPPAANLAEHCLVIDNNSKQLLYLRKRFTLTVVGRT